jgi:hypothetical protein
VSAPRDHAPDWEIEDLRLALVRWQERFMQEGYDGLLRDKTRPSRIRPPGSSVTERVVTLTQSDPPAEATHWTSALMAKVVDTSASSVQRIWRAHGLRAPGDHGLQPHRVKQFKLSTDPQFVDKLRDIVGLYVDPPAHAVVLSVDEKSQIQALSTFSTAPSSAITCSATGTRSSFASSTPLKRKCRPKRTRPTSIRRFANGFSGIPAGPSTSPRLRHLGSTRSRASSPN